MLDFQRMVFVERILLIHRGPRLGSDEMNNALEELGMGSSGIYICRDSKIRPFISLLRR